MIDYANTNIQSNSKNILIFLQTSHPSTEPIYRVSYEDPEDAEPKLFLLAKNKRRLNILAP